MKLTRKQEMFIREYLVDLNAAQAAIRAGYSKKSAKEQGHENLTKPHIQKKIQSSFEERASKLDVKSEDVLKNLLDIANKCNGKVQGYDFQPKYALKAWELIAKHLGMFEAQQTEDRKKEIGTVFIIPSNGKEPVPLG